jgi:tetratricopeptide (TPR) repeat protein
MGQTNKALEDFSYVLTEHPNFASGFNSRGLFYKNKAMLQEALEDYNKAISIEQASDYFINRASIFQLFGDDSKALSDYDKALEIDPSNDTIYNNRANFWNSRGKEISENFL